MIALVLMMGCIEGLAGFFGVDQDQEATVEAIVGTCADGVLEVEAFVSGQEIARVELTVSNGVVGDMAPDYSWLGSEELWTASVAADCDIELQIDVAVITSCDRGEGSTTITPPTASAVQPSFGPNSGGTALTIAVSSAEDFAGASVEIGDGTDWLSLTDVSVESDCPEVGADCIRGTTPDLSEMFPEEDPADIRITTDSGEYTLPAAFTVYVDNSGLSGGFGRAQMFVWDPAWMNYASPYADIGDVTSFLQVDLLFHEPIDDDDSFLSREPLAGTCEWGSSNYTSHNVGTSIRLDGPLIGSHNVPASGNVYPYVSTGPVSTWADSTIDLTVVQENDAGVPPQTFTEAFVLPPRMEWTSFDDPSAEDFVSGTATTVRGQDITLEWLAAQDLDAFTWELAAVSGYTELSSLTCGADPDDEQVVIPWGDVVSEELTDSVDGFLLQASFHVDARTAMHDGSHFWGRSTVWIWSYITVVDE